MRRTLLRTIILAVLVYVTLTSIFFLNKVNQNNDCSNPLGSLDLDSITRTLRQKEVALERMKEDNRNLRMEFQRVSTLLSKVVEKNDNDEMAQLQKQFQKVPISRRDELLRQEILKEMQERNTTKPKVRHYEKLNIILPNHVQLQDCISDCWLMNKANFLKQNPDQHACTQYMTSMFVDWTDFSVEHLSKWWNLLNIIEDPDSTIFNKTISLYARYLQKVKNHMTIWSSYRHIHEVQGESALSRTIALIAFQPIESQSNKIRGHTLAINALAATIASLYQVGFGRIVVVGYRDGDERSVLNAFGMVNSTFRARREDKIINDVELEYVRISSKEWVFTRHVNINIIRGSIIGLQLALTKQLNATQTRMWLGSRSDATDYWKYVFLSEPDTILHTKPWLLPSIRHELDNDLVFFPHRLQPLPHESDLEGVSSEIPLPSNMLPFSNITLLDPLFGHDHCCDAGDFLPGRSKEFGRMMYPCDDYPWWACGYLNQTKDMNEAEIRQVHKRLLEYPMLRLEVSGTGLVFGSSERGRKCIPMQSPCPDGI